MTVEYTGKRLSQAEIATVVDSVPATPNNPEFPIFYYEVTINDTGLRSLISIGVVHIGFEGKRHIGIN
jgi:hypothetical protein